jgi:hypothetical protein
MLGKTDEKTQSRFTTNLADWRILAGAGKNGFVEFLRSSCQKLRMSIGNQII